MILKLMATSAFDGTYSQRGLQWVHWPVLDSWEPSL